VIDPEAHRVSILAPPGAKDEKEVRESRALSSRLTIEPSRVAEVSFDARGLASGGDFKLTSGGIVYHVTVDRLTGRVRSVRE
jgi:hypothetical protein